MSNSTGQSWFYHSSYKNKNEDKVNVPPASQIPGLSALVPEENITKKKEMNDYGSKYIRLAKEGGRKNLLTFNEESNKSLEAKSYPRVEWFDHDEPEKPADLQNSDTKWKAPSYMRHTDDVTQDNYDVTSEYNDVTMTQASRQARDEAGENKRRGQKKIPPFHTNHKGAVTNKSVSRSSLKRVEFADSLYDNDFTKLLSNGYHADRGKFQKMKNIQLQNGQIVSNNKKQVPVRSEYQQHICKFPNKLKPLPKIKLKSHSNKFENNHSPWKLSRFEKVKAKVNTRS